MLDRLKIILFSRLFRGKKNLRLIFSSAISISNLFLLLLVKEVQVRAGEVLKTQIHMDEKMVREAKYYVQVF